MGQALLPWGQAWAVDSNLFVSVTVNLLFSVTASFSLRTWMVGTMMIAFVAFLISFNTQTSLTLVLNDKITNLNKIGHITNYKYMGLLG